MSFLQHLTTHLSKTEYCRERKGRKIYKEDIRREGEKNAETKGKKIFFSNCIIIFAKLYILSKQKTETRLRPLRPKHSREITSHTISLLLLKDYSKHVKTCYKKR